MGLVALRLGTILAWVISPSCVSLALSLANFGEALGANRDKLLKLG